MNTDQQSISSAGDSLDPPAGPYSSRETVEGTKPLDLALVVAENLRLLVLAPLAAGLLVLGIGFLTTPTYTAITRILPPQQQQSASSALLAQFGGALAAAGVAAKNPADQYVAFIRSRRIADEMIARFKLKELWQVQLNEDARQGLSGITRVTNSTQDGIILIEVDDVDPKRAADLANAYVDELRGLVKTLALTEPAQRRAFFDAQLKQAKDNLAKAEIALRGSGISEATLRVIPQSSIDALARIKAQITAQEIKLATLRASMTDSNPAYMLAIQELAALRTELSKEERNDSTKTSGAGAEYIAKARDFKYYETLFDLMARQYESARLDEAREGSIIQVLDVALPPERKSKPKKAQNAVLATLATFFALIVFILLRQSIRNMARYDESAQKLQRLRQLLRLRRK